MEHRNNNRGLIITLIILLVIVIFLLTGLMIFLIAGNSVGITKYLPNSSDAETIYDESFDMNDVQSLNVESDAGDIDIIAGDYDSIHVIVTGGKNNNISFENDNGNAVLKSTSPTVNNRINLFSLRHFDVGADIEIYLPREFADVKVLSNFGDITVNGDFGGNIQINNDFGDIDADILSGKFDFHTDCGNIDISSVNISTSSTATTNMGDIEIDYTNKIRIDAETSMGDRDVNVKDYKSDIVLTLQTDMGDIEVN